MPAFRSWKGDGVPVEQLSLGLSQASRGAHTHRESEKGLSDAAGGTQAQYQKELLRPKHFVFNEIIMLLC